MIEDHPLAVGGEVCESEDLEEESVPAEPRGQTRDGRRGAREHARDLTVRGAVDETRCDGDEQLGTLQIVRRCEGLLGEGPEAAGAAEAPDAPAIPAAKR